MPVRDESYLALVDGSPFLATRAAPVRLEEDADLVERLGALTDGERGDLETAQGPVRYLAVPLSVADGESRGVFVVAQLLTRELEQIDDNTRAAAVIAAIILLTTTFIAWLLAGRLLRPVHDLTDTARTISETDLSRRIPVRGDDEIAELARTFNDMLDRLEHGFETQRAFVDDAGHELRTPITVIRGQLDVMGDDPDERREVMDVVNTELDRMSRIVEDLLLLAKAEQRDFVRLDEVELSDFTTELLVKARSLGARDWRSGACAEGTAPLDAQRVTQAVLNLARNAVEHAPAEARITLGSERVDGSVCFYVSDTGPTIDDEDAERIFERFSRGGRRVRTADGAGLGLAIVRAVAEAHGGTARWRPGEDGGNRFELVVPAATSTEVRM